MSGWFFFASLFADERKAARRVPYLTVRQPDPTQRKIVVGLIIGLLITIYLFWVFPFQFPQKSVDVKFVPRDTK